MGLTRVAIVRPVFMLMIISALVILGLVAFSRLNAELYPSLNIPAATVVTNYPGAAPDDVERLITRPIEDAVAGVPNVDTLVSTSTEGSSQVQITFSDSADPDVAATDVERRVSAIRGSLPIDATAPSVFKFDTSQIAVLDVAYAGSLSLDKLFRIADEQIKPRLETQSGVAQVSIAGGLEREIQVQVNPSRLRAYSLTLEQIQQALDRENQGLPGGTLERGAQQENLRLYGLFQSVDELRDLTVATTDSGTVRLADLAQVVDTTKRVTSRTFFNGREAVSLSITKQATANEIATVDAVRAEIDRLNDTLPAGSQLSVISDTSVFTRHSLEGVLRSLVEAVVLTGLVLLVFLHTVRSTMIVLFAIPTSLIATFLVMNFLGFTLNVMSTMALVLVIGVLVDDSIVVLENIFRYLELGETPWSAAIKGRSEIGLAAIAITLVDVVVFTPVAFMSGLVGSYFRQFGLVIVSATLLSLFISFTLTPLLASRWLQSGHQGGGRGPWQAFTRRFETGLGWLTGRYSGLLGWSLRHRWLPPSLALLSLILAFAMVPLGLVKFEFVPQTDDGLFALSVELPPGSSLDATERALRQVEQRVAALPEVETYLATSGNGGARFGRIQVVLVDRAHRQRSQSEVATQAAADAANLPNVTVRASEGGALQPIQVRINGDDPRVLQRLAERVEQLLQATPGTRDVTNGWAAGNPETRLLPDRRRMADLGVTTEQTALALRTTVEGTVATKLRPEGQDEVDVRLIADEPTRASLTQVGELPLLASRGGEQTLIALSQVTRPVEVTGPTSIERRDRQRVVTVSADLATNTPLGDVTPAVQEVLSQLTAEGAVPVGYQVQLGGQVEDQAEAFNNLLLALGLSIVLEYMLLAALYESLILPLATMFALPVAVVGAFLALAITNNTLNLLSMIGVVVLTGLVGKNGILLVDYTNTLRQQGLERAAALRQAGATRLRPILMTTTALVFGLLPLAAKLEAGSEIYGGMATVIIGGMLSSTLLSLVVVPCMYTYFDDLQHAIQRLWRWRPKRRQPAPVPPPAPGRPEREPVTRTTG